MAASIAERLGVTLERLGKGLQERARPKESTSPELLRDKALELWRLTAPGRKADPSTSAISYFVFSSSEGVTADTQEKQLFDDLLKPYWHVHDYDGFMVILSVNPDKLPSVSFKLSILAPAPPQLPFEGKSAVLAFREFPPDRSRRRDYPYNLLIQGENRNFYSDILDQEVTGFDPTQGLQWQQLEKYSVDYQPRGDIEWRKKFTSDVLDLLIDIIKKIGYDEVAQARMDQFWRRSSMIRGRWLGEVESENREVDYRRHFNNTSLSRRNRFSV